MPHKRPRLVRVLRVRSRRALVRLDRAAPFLLMWVPSWGTSLMLHALGLLLLALYLYARSNAAGERTIRAEIAAQLTEDLTSLLPATRAGDPFTTAKTDEPPSLSIDPTPTKEPLVNQPALPALARFAPELALPTPPIEPTPSPPKGTARGKGAATPLHVEEMVAPFSGRQGESKATLVRREGGTVRSEKAVEDGIDWLVRHQRADGSWSLNYHGQCQGTGCPEQVAIDSDTAATGLALLPLLGAGHIHTAKSRYQGAVRRGLDALIRNQQPSGDLFTGTGPMARMYSHAIATMALCEAYGLSHDQALRPAAQGALNFIIRSQNAQDGGWRYFPEQPGDTSVFGWQMFALRSARLAGLKVPKNVTKGCRTYLDLAAADDRKTTYSYRPGREASFVMTAEALLSRQYLGWPRDFPPLVKGAAHIAADLERSTERNIYYWYYATQLLHNMQNKDWKRWNVRVREGLIVMQTQGKDCDRGSWDPARPQVDRWSTTGGRLFLTSLSLLTLEVYYRYLPLYQPSDIDPDAIESEDPAARARKTAGRPAPRAIAARP